MGGKKKYINIFSSFTEPFSWWCHNTSLPNSAHAQSGRFS